MLQRLHRSIQKRLPKLHYLSIQCLKIIATIAASEAKITDDASPTMKHLFPNSRDRYLLSARSLEEVIKLREQLQLLHDGVLESHQIWIEKDTDLSSTRVTFTDDISDVFHAGMDYLKAREEEQASRLLQRYHGQLRQWLKLGDPDMNLIDQVIARNYGT